VGIDKTEITLTCQEWFALSDRVLLEFVGTLPAKTSWWLHMGQTTQIEIVHATRILKELLDACSHQNPAMLLRLVDRLCGYSAVIANLENGRRRLADWQAFIALVFTLESGLRECSTVVRRIDNLLQVEQKVPRPPLEAVDAVSLMTIHAAKGLEWPVVVVADLARRPPSSTPAILIDPDLGVALTWREDTAEKLRPALYKILECQKEQREREETARLLYVALTCARDSVILTASDLQGGSLNLLEPGLLAAQVDFLQIIKTDKEV
jgi:ATP-dependent helicase/nuclease subunit A